MRRALRAGSALGAATVGLTVVSTLVLLALGRQRMQVFETAYLVNVVCYAVAAFRAVRATGRVEAQLLDALVAATWAGALGTVLQGALLGALDAGILVAVAVMLVIEWLTAAVVAPLCGWAGLLSRHLAPPRAAGAPPASAAPAAPAPLAEGETSAAEGSARRDGAASHHRLSGGRWHRALETLNDVRAPGQALK